MIEFKCGNCGVAIRAADDKAGRPGKCPKCGSQVQVPGKSYSPGVVPATVGVASASSRRGAVARKPAGRHAGRGL